MRNTLVKKILPVAFLTYKVCLPVTNYSNKQSIRLFIIVAKVIDYFTESVKNDVRKILLVKYSICLCDLLVDSAAGGMHISF